MNTERKEPSRKQQERFSKLIKRLEKIFQQEGYSKRKAHDIAFHMLDWIGELEGLYDTFKHIGRKTNKQVRDSIQGFLVHAPHHINAAKFLYGLGVPEDVFDLGFSKPKRKRRK